MHPQDHLPYVGAYFGTTPTSYSQEIDRRVTIQESPYGYDNEPPADGYENPASKAQMYSKQKPRGY